MITAFQSSAFQNNAFQIGGSDTHDGLPRKHHKINLPIYEFTKKAKPLTAQENAHHITEQYNEVTPNEIAESAHPAIRMPAWDNSAIEAYAAKASLTFAEAERRIKALQKIYEDEDEEFVFMIMAATLH